jgi:predicted Zn finger-like uncharacterized protein
MILECPACQARFAVADAQIPLGGRTVRCGRCATQWHVEKPVEQGQAEAPVHTSEAPAVAATDDFLQQLEADAREICRIAGVKPSYVLGGFAL